MVHKYPYRRAQNDITLQVHESIPYSVVSCKKIDTIDGKMLAFSVNRDLIHDSDFPIIMRIGYGSMHYYNAMKYYSLYLYNGVAYLDHATRVHDYYGLVMDKSRIVAYKLFDCDDILDISGMVVSVGDIV